MYEHLLLATDGSDVASRAADHALGLAKAVGARVTALTVSPPWSAMAYGVVQGLDSHEAYDKAAAAHAEAVLAEISIKATALGVLCDTIHTIEVNPYQAILATAEAIDCDLIVVGAHGRRGVERLLLGSETVKLLTHAKRPVLVWRG